MKLNCWEFKKCGREPGGTNADEHGICPVTTLHDLNTAYGGKNAGRACWVVAGSFSRGRAQGIYAGKLKNCWNCEFMNAVKQEEEKSATGFSPTRIGIERTLEWHKKH